MKSERNVLHKSDHQYILLP